ncbi:MAG TPA: hypothetical protein VIF12_02725 [Micavibrio sp.]|jgi:hypothetical protein
MSAEIYKTIQEYIVYPQSSEQIIARIAQCIESKKFRIFIPLYKSKKGGTVGIPANGQFDTFKDTERVLMAYIDGMCTSNSEAA